MRPPNRPPAPRNSLVMALIVGMAVIVIWTAASVTAMLVTGPH